MKCFRIILSVDGNTKGFRFEILQKALNLGITGYVTRNGIDAYQIIAEGTEDNLNDFISWIDEGFHWTHIISGKKEEIPVEGFSTFEIRNNPDIQQRKRVKSLEGEVEDDNLTVSARIQQWFRRKR